MVPEIVEEIDTGAAVSPEFGRTGFVVTGTSAAPAMAAGAAHSYCLRRERNEPDVPGEAQDLDRTGQRIVPVALMAGGNHRLRAAKGVVVPPN